MESTSNERIKLARKVLSARYDRTVRLSESEIETLKSYVQGEATEMSTEDLAGEVIQQELKEQKIAREKSKGEST
jgi:hypothetical protein